jgi:hypothetical protein
MMVPRRTAAALATVVTTLAVTVPAAGARTPPPVPPMHAAHVAQIRLQPGSPICELLIARIRAGVATGNTAWANVLSQAFIYLGCGGAAI